MGPFSRESLGATNWQRCNILWLNLRGSDSDFDGAYVTTAEALGLVSSDHRDLADLVNAAEVIIDATPWKVLRRIAVDVFWDVYDDADWGCYEAAEVDWRTSHQMLEDAQFDDGRCRPCGLGVPLVLPDFTSPAGLPATTTPHQAITTMVLRGRLSWDDVARWIREDAIPVL